MRHRILCTIEGIVPEAVKILRHCGEIECRSLTQKELPKAVRECTCLVVQLGLQINQAVIAAAPKLQCIATATTGLDHIDREYAKKKGLTVLSLQGEIAFLKTITATAELALGLLLAIIRHIPSAHQSVLQGKWDRPAFSGHSLAGKTLGIVGFGRLGSVMGKYGKALGMKVIFTDPKKGGSTPLIDLLKTADIISLHVPLIEETKKMIGSRELKHMQPSAILINTARGKIVDEDAIIAALKMKKLAGYGADVLADELSFSPTRARAALIDYARTHDNVILTPHIGGTTVEARESTDIFIAKKVKHYFGQRRK